MVDKLKFPSFTDEIETRKIFADEAKAVLIESKEIVKKIRYFRLIKSIKKCDVEVISKKIFVLKDAWKVVVLLKLIIKFVDWHGKERVLVRLVNLIEIVPFPLTKKPCYPVDFAKLPVVLKVLSAECIDVSFDNYDCFSIIKAVIKVVFKIVAFERELLKVLVIEHDK